MKKYSPHVEDLIAKVEASDLGDRNSLGADFLSFHDARHRLTELTGEHTLSVYHEDRNWQLQFWREQFDLHVGHNVPAARLAATQIRKLTSGV